MDRASLEATDWAARISRERKPDYERAMELGSTPNLRVDVFQSPVLNDEWRWIVDFEGFILSDHATKNEAYWFARDMGWQPIGIGITQVGEAYIPERRFGKLGG